MLPITPLTRVGELLDAYPQLEETLIEIAPIFEKLRVPMLRKTVAKLATLEKAAGIAGIETKDLVMRLRKDVGQDLLEGHDNEPEGLGEGEGKEANGRKRADETPAWVTTAEILETLAVEALLAEGQHPLAKVRGLLNDAAPGQAVRLESEFQPIPLIDELKSSDFRIHSQEDGAGHWTTLITR